MANLFFGVMTQIDVMLVKHYFSSHEAGIYASAAIVGKAVMYLPDAIVLALFPMVASNQASGQSSDNPLFKSIGLTLLLSGSGAVVLILFPKFVMGVLFGSRYLGAASIASLFGIAMLPMSLIFLMMNYLLAKSKIKFVGVMGVGVLIEMAGFLLFHNSLNSVLYVIMSTGIITFFFILILEFSEFYKRVDYFGSK